MDDYTDIRDQCKSWRNPGGQYSRRKLPEDVKERLRRRAMRHERSLEAEVRAILERVAREPLTPTGRPEPFPDWFIRMTRPGIDLDPAIEENRAAHEGMDL